MTDLTTPTQMRILFIDDSPDDALLLQFACSESGLDAEYKLVDSAHALSEALHETWHAIVSDFRMPGFGAEPALQIIRQRDERIPFIVVSHAINTEETERLLALGADEVLEKSARPALPLVIKKRIASAYAATPLRN